jgi:hypothetical protein
VNGSELYSIFSAYIFIFSEYTAPVSHYSGQVVG